MDSGLTLVDVEDVLPLITAEAKSEEDSALSYLAVHYKRGGKRDTWTHSYCQCRRPVTTYRPPPPSAEQDTMEQLPCLSQQLRYRRSTALQHCYYNT